MKKVFIIFIVLFAFCCCLSTLAILGFAYFEANNNCAYRGPFATPTSGACAQKQNNQNNVEIDHNSELLYEDDAYTFVYPKDWVIDNSSSSIVYLYKSEEKAGDNLNIFHQNFAQDLNINREYCDTYKVNFSGQLEGLGYTNLQITESELITVNGSPTCLIAYYGEYNDRIIYQKQYLLEDIASSGSTFYLTVTTSSQAALDGFDSVIDSFIIK